MVTEPITLGLTESVRSLNVSPHNRDLPIKMYEACQKCPTLQAELREQRDRNRAQNDENTRLHKEIQRLGLEGGRLRDAYTQIKQSLGEALTKAELLQERNDVLEVAQLRQKKRQQSKITK
jgi:hypothetical protein